MNERFASTLGAHLPLLGDHTIDASTELFALGLDSIHAVELLFALEDEFDIELPESALSQKTFATAGALWAQISMALNSERRNPNE